MEIMLLFDIMFKYYNPYLLHLGIYIYYYLEIMLLFDIMFKY